MRRCVIVLCILAALTVPVLAMDVLEEERQILNVDTLTDGLPDDAQDALRAYSPAARTDPGEAILAIIKWASGLSVSTLREAVQTASLLLSAALICQLVRQSVPDDRLHIQAMTGALAITLLFATNIKSMIGLAVSVLDEMEAYSKLLLPVMCGAAAASGAELRHKSENAHRRSHLLRCVGHVVPTCAVLWADRASVQVCATQTPRSPSVRRKKTRAGIKPALALQIEQRR